MFCSECGTENPDTNRFCNNCGKPLVRQQPAAQPAVQPAVQPPVQPVVPPAPAPAATPVPQPVQATPAVPAPGKRRDWLGIVSLITGILSWGILTTVLGIITILLGAAALVLFRKAAGRISLAAVISIILGIAAIAVKIAFI